MTYTEEEKRAAAREVLARRRIFSSSAIIADWSAIMAGRDDSVSVSGSSLNWSERYLRRNASGSFLIIDSAVSLHM